MLKLEHMTGLTLKEKRSIISHELMNLDAITAPYDYIQFIRSYRF